MHMIPFIILLFTPAPIRLWYLVNRESGILVGLDGALQRLLVNGVVYPRLTEAATEQRGVTTYLGPPCHPNPCTNGGLCVPLLANFTCRCTVMFAGELCHKSESRGTRQCNGVCLAVCLVFCLLKVYLFIFSCAFLSVFSYSFHT